MHTPHNMRACGIAGMIAGMIAWYIALHCIAWFQHTRGTTTQVVAVATTPPRFENGPSGQVWTFLSFGNRSKRLGEAVQTMYRSAYHASLAYPPQASQVHSSAAESHDIVAYISSPFATSARNWSTVFCSCHRVRRVVQLP